jgi:branched-chain amino acid transport system substrate-binding protein
MVVASVAAILALAACQPAGQSPGQSGGGQSSGKTLKLGASVALTGPVSREGNLVKDGYQYWMDKVNAAGGIDIGGEKYKVEIVFYDDESEADTGTRLTEKLISEDQVDFLLGPFSSGITQATTTIGERNKVLTIAPQANADAIYERGYKYVFSVLPAASTYLRGVIDMAGTLSPKPEKVAVMIRDDPFGIAAGDGAVKYAKEKGFDVVFSAKYPANATDVSSILTSVQSANPDILLASTLFEDSALITRQAKDLQFAPKLMAFTAGPALPDFAKSLGADGNFVMGSEWWLPSLNFEGEKTLGSTQEYAAAIKDKFGYVPGYHTASGSMAGLVLQLALEKAGTLDVDAVREALLQLKPETFWGPIGWDETGKNVVGTSIPVQILDGKATSVWPEKGREKPPVYPFPAWNAR